MCVHSREWQWLHDALNQVARARAEQGDAAAFRLMQAQAMAVGQRRVALRLKMAQLEGPRDAWPTLTAERRWHGIHTPSCAWPAAAANGVGATAWGPFSPPTAPMRPSSSCS